MVCPKCAIEIREFERLCPNCLTDVGFPNIRACQTPEEITALNKRYDFAHNQARANDSFEAVKRFEDAVKRSVAVICRPLRIAEQL